MVSPQKIKDSSGDSADAVKPGSPKSRLAMLKRSKPKNNTDPFRFQGSGIDFKGKLIGEQDVGEARGDQMCSDAMRAAKAAVKQAGSHKQRVMLNISIDGLKIKDEKSGAILFNFPVSKISFIARDTTDARAFGFIFGSGDGKYKFYGIKTAQTADNAVLSIRDMFQVVFEMKKKQIQEMKQKKEVEQNEQNAHKENNFRIEDGVPCADLLDLESELQNLEQGCNQLQNIPSMPEDQAWPSHTNDPFGDSFAQAAQAPVDGFWPTPAHQPTVPNGLNGFTVPQTTIPQAPVSFNVFSGTNPFATAAPSGVVRAADPFDTLSAQRVINAINTTQSYGLLPPPPRQPAVLDLVAQLATSPPSSMNGSNGQASPEINWGVSASSASSFKENNAPTPQNNSANVFSDDFTQSAEPKVTTLEEAFSKLVDMDKLVPLQNPAAETKKNPFEHIINPPKLPLNAMPPSSGFAPAPTAQLVSANGVARDPFNDDFFS